MNNSMVKEVNATTGEEIERKMNAEELAQLEIDKIAEAKRLEAEATKAAEKAAAIEKLAVLGLTIDDLNVLGLGNN